jgi:hypothetical protein
MMEPVETGLFESHLELRRTSQDFDDYHALVAEFKSRGSLLVF